MHTRAGCGLHESLGRLTWSCLTAFPDRMRPHVWHFRCCEGNIHLRLRQWQTEYDQYYFSARAGWKRPDKCRTDGMVPLLVYTYHKKPAWRAPIVVAIACILFSPLILLYYNPMPTIFARLHVPGPWEAYLPKERTQYADSEQLLTPAASGRAEVDFVVLNSDPQPLPEIDTQSPSSKGSKSKYGRRQGPTEHADLSRGNSSFATALSPI